MLYFRSKRDDDPVQSLLTHRQLPAARRHPTEVEAYKAANKLRAECCPVRRASCFDVRVTVGDVAIDTDTGPGVWFSGAGF